MTPTTRRPVEFVDLLLGLLVLLTAGGARVWYLSSVVDVNGPATAVWQGEGRGPLVSEDSKLTELDVLVTNLRKDGIPQGYRSPAPLKVETEDTAHRGPGYP